MENFFNNVAYDEVEPIEQASRLIFELRENRAGLLKPYAVPDESALLDRLVAGTLPEHPTYEHYLSARILARTRDCLRKELNSHLLQLNGTPVTPDTVQPQEDGCDHIDLMAQLAARYVERLDGEPQLTQDAVSLRFDTGLQFEFRVAAPDAYAFHWLWGEAELAIDTAPQSQPPGTRLSHFHDADGRCQVDPLTSPDRAPCDNLCTLIDALLIDPLLGQPSS